MAALHYNLGLLLICLGLLYSPVNADTCVKKTPCRCEFSNGTGIDLSDSMKASFYTTQFYKKNPNSNYELLTFYFHPCTDAQVPNVDPADKNNTCATPVSICKYTDFMQYDSNSSAYHLKPGNYEKYGLVAESTFSADGKSLVYGNGPSATTLMLICADTIDRFEVYDGSEPNAFILSFYSPNACMKELEAPGRSTGSTLVIIFFSLVIFYLVVGVCTKKFLMGATGIEVIPNLAFWSDLPNLIKDGWAFAINGFRLPVRGSGPATSPDPNSYDSI